MKRELSTENSTARGRDPDALAVSLYAQWCRADDHCGKAPDGRQFPKWAALSRAEQRRWSAVAILAHGLMRDDPDAIDNNAYNLAEQAQAYPWTGASLPPAAVAPEPEDVPKIPTDSLAIAMHAAMCLAQRRDEGGSRFPNLKSVLTRSRGFHFPAATIQFLRNIHPAIELAQLAVTDPKAAHEALNSLIPMVLPGASDGDDTPKAPVRIGGPFRNLEREMDAERAAKAEAAQKAQRAEDEAMASVVTCSAAYVP